MVIGARMAAITPMTLTTAKAQAEFARMFSEKMAAASESMIAAQFAIAGEMLKMAGSLTPQPTQRAIDRIAAKSVKPYARRVRANAKRLGK
jgi:hypothetical protein